MHRVLCRIQQYLTSKTENLKIIYKISRYDNVNPTFYHYWISACSDYFLLKYNVF